MTIRGTAAAVVRESCGGEGKTDRVVPGLVGGETVLSLVYDGLGAGFRVDLELPVDEEAVGNGLLVV